MEKLLFEEFHQKVQKYLKDICHDEKENMLKAIEVMSNVLIKD